jgi:monofunctional biosynthetic peptidoglycan transglycosylase
VKRPRLAWPRAWWKRVLLTIVIVLLLPVPVMLALSIIDPPVTSVMLVRVGQRLVNGDRPVWPAHDAIARSAMSPYLRRAVLASEDDRFYLHHGIDFVELENALARKRAGGKLRGASTLTQQVAKNIFLWNGRSFVRKGLEAYLALWLDLLLSKERILDLYLNLAEWGPNAFGAEAAARVHYHKSAARLTRDEAARLAAILPSPRRWPPQGSVASRRVGVILDRMQYAAPKVEPPAPKARVRSR